MTREEAEKIIKNIIWDVFEGSGDISPFHHDFDKLRIKLVDELLEASKLGHVGDDEIEKHIKQKRNPEIDPQLCKMFEGYWIAGAKWYRSKITEDK